MSSDTLLPMTDAQGTDPDLADRWLGALRHLEGSGVFRTAPGEYEDRLPSLWTRLRESASADGPPDVVALAGLLSQIASFSTRPDDWAVPYEPMLNMVEGRTAAPGDLSQPQLNILMAIAEQLPDPLLRARVCDVLAICETGRQRVRWYEAEVDAVLGATVSGATWGRDDDTWDRALLVARRLGSTLDTKLQALGTLLIEYVLTADPSAFPGSVADLLAKHNFAGGRASHVASRMREIAAAAPPEVARGYRARAARWHRMAGDFEAAFADQLFLVSSLMSEAEQLDVASDSNAHARSAHLYERALKELREIPRRRREEMGVPNLTTELASRIRAAGAATLGTMGVFESDAVDLSDSRRQSVEAVSGREPIDALMAFVALMPLVSYAKERSNAEELLREHPLQTLFSNIHYSRDGRVIHRSAGQGGEPIYGEDPATWRQMIQSYEFRISLAVQGALAPAWIALSNEHRLTVENFVEIMRGSSIVPSDHERLLAQALYYGYDGDFITAAQLLAPQVEHIVRLHLRNAGQQTSTLENGVEHEIGLTSLMSRAAVTEIFGEDIAFEIRALLCGPIGPNLRNEFAHGLVNDASVGSAHAFYCWWLVLRLTFVPFWNRLHDTETADSHEPAEHREARDRSEPESQGD